jgi:hypothetical protein
MSFSDADSVASSASKGDTMPEQTASLEQIVGRLLDRLDAMDVGSLGAMVTDDVQSVDEITRRWTRGRAAVESYLSPLKAACQTCTRG